MIAADGHVAEADMLGLARTGLAIIGISALVLGSRMDGTARAATVLPDFGSATFTPGAPVNNSFFPLINRRVRTYVAHGVEDGEPFTERFVLIDRPGVGPVLLGVQTSTQIDRSFEDGLLVEETYDYYAQDTDGNVWYFGEDVTNYIYDDNGNLIDTNNQSAWRAGASGALPGFIMPADLALGFNYFQEFAPGDDALDQGTIWNLGLTRTVPVGTFSGVLRILETTELELDHLEFKDFAPNFGLIAADEGLDASLMNPGLSFGLVKVGTIPEPSIWAMLLLGFGAVGAALRRRKVHAVRVAA